MKDIIPLSIKSELSYLPFKKYVVFVDWHGVLSNHRFWWSILTDQRHPYHQGLKCACDNLFCEKSELVNQWMKGEKTSEQIVNDLDIQKLSRYSDNFIIKRLYSDCKKMPVQKRVIKTLNRIKNDAWLVIATDNMDCFYNHAVDNIPDLKIFDAVLCSSNIGCLKNESPDRFFGQWLSKHNIDKRNALLLDDSELNCQSFRKFGGTTIQVNSEDLAIQELNNWSKLNLGI